MNKIPFYFDNLHDNSINGFTHEYTESSTLFEPIIDTGFACRILSLKVSSSFPSTDVLDDDTYFKVYNYKTDRKYFYPIIWPHTGRDELKDNLVIPETVLNDIRNKSAKILLMNEYEGYSMDGFRNDAKQIAKKNNISAKQIVFLNGNLTILNDKKHVYVNFWESVSEHYHNNFGEFKENLIKDICNHKIRKNKFICLQRRPHPARIAIFSDLYDNRNEGILTLGKGDNKEIFRNNVKGFSHHFPDKLESFNKIRHLLPYEYDVNLQKNNPTHDQNIEKFTDSYLHVVAETYFFNYNDQLFFSEKIFKPVVFMQPFVLFSQTGSLQVFRDLGFRTFPTIIDESYDEIVDDIQRYNMAMKSVKKFISQDIEKINRQIRSILPDLIHNYSVLFGRRSMQSAEVYSKLFSILYNS